MAYTINLTNGDVLTTVQDGTKNTDATNLKLVGKNYTGYGEILNENSIWLLENFANGTAPTAPLTGQLWWNSSIGVLTVFDGTQFKSVSSSATGATAPTGAVEGDLWWDTGNQQLRVYSATSGLWILVGPAYSAATGVSGPKAAIVTDTSSSDHIVVMNTLSGVITTIESKDAQFTPNPAIAGFPVIRPGINLADESLIPGIRTVGKATDSDLIGGLPASRLLLNDVNGTLAGSLAIANDTGLRVGVDDDIQISVGAAAEIYNRIPGENLTIGTTTSGGVARPSIVINGVNGKIDVAAGSPTGSILTGIATPLSGLDAVNMDYVAQLVSTGTTPAAILSQLITVDGAASGLDADLLDGQHGSYYAIASNASPLSSYTKAEADALNSAIISGIDWKEAVATFVDLGTTYPTPVEGWTASVNNEDTIYRYDGSSWVIMANGTVPLATGSIDGKMSSSDFTKLGNISLGASSNTAAEILSLVKTVDVNGTAGINAGTLDGQSSSYYNDWINVSNKPDLTITLTGDASGTRTFTGLTNNTLPVTILTDSHSHTGATISNLAASDTTSGVFNIARIPTGTTSSTVALGNHTHTAGELAAHDHDASDIISGTLSIARIPIGTTSSTVALGNHTHATYDRASSVLSGASVFSNIVVTNGIVTGTNTRNLTASNIGAAAASHTHPYNSIIGTDTDLNTSGAQVIDQIIMTDGVITSPITTRNLTASDIGASASTHTHSNYIRSDVGDIVNASTTWIDNAQIKFGDGADLRIYHNGSNSFMTNHSGSLYIQQAVPDGSGILTAANTAGTSTTCISWGNGSGDEPSAALYYNGSETFRTDLAGITSNINNGFKITNTNPSDGITLIGANGAGESKYAFQSTGSTPKSIIYYDGLYKFATANYGVEIIGSAQATVDFTVTSDARFKDNVEVIDSALDKVNQIRGVTYTRNDLEDTEKRHAGVIAQEVQKVLPEAVHEDEDGMLSVSYGNLNSLLIEAIKELKAEIEILKGAK